MALLTGEARAGRSRSGPAEGQGPPTDDDHRGAHPAAPHMAVIDFTALAPMPRRVVKVVLVSEQVR
jgi:hypothetical protein